MIVKIGGIQFSQYSDSYSWWEPNYQYPDRMTDMPVSEKRFDFPDSLKCYYSRRKYYSPLGGYSYTSVKDIFKSDTITVGEKCDSLFARLEAKYAFSMQRIHRYVIMTAIQKYYRDFVCTRRKFRSIYKRIWCL